MMNNFVKSTIAIWWITNSKDPYKYLKELFERLPYAKKTDEDYEKLLPYHEVSLF